MNLIELIVKVLAEVIALARAGLSDDEIRERIAAPGQVGEQLIEAIAGRRDRIGRYVRTGKVRD